MAGDVSRTRWLWVRLWGQRRPVCFQSLLPPALPQAAPLLFQGTACPVPGSRRALKDRCSGCDFQAWLQPEGHYAANSGAALVWRCLYLRLQQKVGHQGELRLMSQPRCWTQLHPPASLLGTPWNMSPESCFLGSWWGSDSPRLARPALGLFHPLSQWFLRF